MNGTGFGVNYVLAVCIYIQIPAMLIAQIKAHSATDVESVEGLFCNDKCPGFYLIVFGNEKFSSLVLGVLNHVIYSNRNTKVVIFRKYITYVVGNGVKRKIQPVLIFIQNVGIFLTLVFLEAKYRF